MMCKVKPDTQIDQNAETVAKSKKVTTSSFEGHKPTAAYLAALKAVAAMEPTKKK